MLGVPIGRESAGKIKARSATSNNVEQASSYDRAGNLRNNVRTNFSDREASTGCQTDGDGGVEVKAEIWPIE